MSVWNGLSYQQIFPAIYRGMHMFKPEGSQEMYNGTKYQLRHAAGLYWLLDMEQEGFPYRSSLPMNEIGACIFRLREQGMEREQIADRISEEYGVERSVALADAAQFLEELKGRGI